MASKNSSVSWLLLLGLSFILLIILAQASDDDRKGFSYFIMAPELCATLAKPKLNMNMSSTQMLTRAYIVYMGDRPKGDLSASSLQTIQQALGSNSSASLLYTYKRSFHGFAMKLTKEEMLRVAAMDEVVSVFPNGKKQLHTTRSWDFMGFSQRVKRTTVESNIVVGMFDTGVWPESASFSDKGFGPPPRKWKGTCQTQSNFTCNKKIIGARYYRSDGRFGAEDLRSSRDSKGHGTHTASTVAGGLVRMASLMGLGLGTARGCVPSARIAVYKVCWSDGCYDADILAAFDDAIADGVDVISISIGSFGTIDYFSDSIAIGAFHAMKNGILTSTSGGNDGPSVGTIENYSPWILTVAASTTDRKFLTKVKLGNKLVYKGVSINTYNPKNSIYPMIYGGNAPNTTGGFDGSLSRYCDENTLDSSLVRGKIVLCDSIGDGEAPLLAGAAGTVMQDGDSKDVAFLFPLPTTYLGVKDGAKVFSYINSTRKPTATIMKSNEVKDTLAPYVAYFSSRGPNPVTRDILKPDITAPGVDILAAFSLLASPSEVEGDKRRAAYNFMSGTSMACPHVTGVAGYIKSFHPSWSPAAIKSALMTTCELHVTLKTFILTPKQIQYNSLSYVFISAIPMSVATTPDAEFAYGAGHVNPIKAPHPGLVYDAHEIDYIKFLCGQGYRTTALRLVTGDKSTCSKARNGTVWDLNLPSFTLSTLPAKSFGQIFRRTVTNVGSPRSTYHARIRAPRKLKIKINPAVLSFTSLGQKLSFTVKVGGRSIRRNSTTSGSLVWDDGRHQVRSPIVVYSLSG
ncbi:unnamed protein product [Ilex paraguariensis]|uniref:Cucumisin n=1 Tax=Ilex paraguariensis TaxID=185542 RepID=A0ABC8QSI9_9AQUA